MKRKGMTGFTLLEGEAHNHIQVRAKFMRKSRNRRLDGGSLRERCE